MNENTIVIVGGGVSGLVTAIELERSGHECVIFEKEPEVGGRIKTEVIDGIPMDHGFQVLLSAYPLCKEYLDYEKLKLRAFRPGATIFKGQKETYLGDPLRDLKATFSTLSSWAGTLGDKIKIYTLSQRLKKKSISEIFASNDSTTYDYLKSLGFSNKIIGHFFQPFFSGIFLEEQLKTSSGMFEFVFKMFAEGNATIPENGMQEIPKNLLSQLKSTKVLTNTKAEIKTDGSISLNTGETFTPKAIVSAVPIVRQESEWKGCTTFYMKCDKYVLDKNCIGLVEDKESVISSFFYMDLLNPRIPAHTLSVTCLDANLKQAELKDQVIKDLDKYLGISNVEILKTFHVPQSLTSLDRIGEMNNSQLEFRGKTPIVWAGDYLNHASIQGAMVSGRNAALSLNEHFI